MVVEEEVVEDRGRSDRGCNNFFFCPAAWNENWNEMTWHRQTNGSDVACSIGYPLAFVFADEHCISMA